MSTLPTKKSGTKKWTVESDESDDKQNGIKIGSAKDKALDKKRGV
jgi:hypothetical protein